MKHLLFVFAIVGCGSHDSGTVDDEVGSSCVSDRDCAYRCYLDNNDHFPGGFCSISCVSDRDCPIDTYCVTTAGGVCMFACPEFDCSILGPSWGCDTRDHAGGGEVRVCIGNP